MKKYLLLASLALVQSSFALDSFEGTLKDCKDSLTFKSIQEFEMDGGFGLFEIKTTKDGEGAAKIQYSGIEDKFAEKFKITFSEGKFTISMKETYNIINDKLYFGSNKFGNSSVINYVGKNISFGNFNISNISNRNNIVIFNGKVISSNSDSNPSEGINISKFIVSINIPNVIPTTFDVGSAEVTVEGGLKGNSDVVVSGSGSFKADDLTGKKSNIKVSGSGRVDIHKYSYQKAKIKVSGSGDIDIGEGKLDELDVSVSGSGDISLGSDTIDTLDVSVSGSGDINIINTVKDVDASVSGSGDIRINKATGKIKKKVCGSGSIKIKK